jgi:hypothetical protein
VMGGDGNGDCDSVDHVDGSGVAVHWVQSIPT